MKHQERPLEKSEQLSKEEKKCGEGAVQASGGKLLSHKDSFANTLGSAPSSLCDVGILSGHVQLCGVVEGPELPCHPDPGLNPAHHVPAA